MTAIVSDYRESITGEIKPWPDLLPAFVGAITFVERKRRNHGESLREFYLANCKEYSLLSDWPRPEDESAYIRSVLHAARNGAFLGYQAGTAILIGSYGISKVLEKLTDLL